MNPLSEIYRPDQLATKPAAPQHAVAVKSPRKNRYSSPKLYGLPEALTPSKEIILGITSQRGADRPWQFYRCFLDESRDACFLTDHAGEILECNRSACAFFGMPRDELVNCSLPCLINPERFESLEAELRGLLSRGRYQESDVCLQPPGRPMIFATVTIDLIPNCGGRNLLQWTIRDETKLNHLEEGLRASRESLSEMESVLQSTEEGVIVRDLTGHIRFANDAAAQAMSSPCVQLLLGAPIEDVLKTHVIIDEQGHPIRGDWQPSKVCDRAHQPISTTLGFLSLSSGEMQWWSAKTILIHDTYGCLHSVAHCFRDVTSDRRAENALRALKEQKDISADIALNVKEGMDAAIQAERTRLANEIHDTLAQSLAAISMHLDAARSALQNGSEEAHALIACAADLAREGLRTARHSIWDLRPRELESRRLGAALANMAAKESDGLQAKVRFKESGKRVPLRSPVEAALLRIGQEALKNALTHSFAKNIRITLKWQSRGILLRVADDGCGIDHSQAPDGGYGMIGMRERAEFLKGRLWVRTRPGKGTCLFARVPIINRQEKGEQCCEPGTHSHSHR